MRFKNLEKLKDFPSVALLTPAHNEGIVLEDTLRALAWLEYSGQLDIYVLDDNSQDDTAEIAQEFTEGFFRIHYIPVSVSFPSGKLLVLNCGLSILQVFHIQFISVYMMQIMSMNRIRSIIGRSCRTNAESRWYGWVYKTKNAHTNILTRIIGLEFQLFPHQKLLE